MDDDTTRIMPRLSADVPIRARLRGISEAWGFLLTDDRLDEADFDEMRMLLRAMGRDLVLACERAELTRIDEADWSQG